MYEGDAPVAERRAQALQLDRALLSELLSAGDLRELLDAEAIAEVEGELAGGARRRTADDDHDRLRRLGDMPPEAVPHAEQLIRERRAVAVRIAGRERLIAAEDAGLYRDAHRHRASRPGCRPRSWSRSTIRWPGWPRGTRGRTGRSPPRSCASGWASTRSQALEELAERGELLRGAFRPGGASEEWVAPDVLRRVRRRTLAALRREVEPVDRDALVRFLPAWHGIGRDLGRGPDRVREVISQLGGVALPVAAWEQDVLPVRVPGYRPADLDALCAAGEAVWIGAGRDRVSLVLREDAPLPGRRPPSSASTRVLDALRGSGALFFRDLQAQLGGTERELLADIWELAWAGLVTNDSWQPLRGGARPRAVPQPLVRRRARPTASLPAAQGRWSPVDRLLATAADAARPRPGAGGGAARPPRRAHPPGGAGRGDPRRVLVGLRRAAADGGGRPLPARVLRRGPGRRAVRAAGGRRAAARRARRRLGGATAVLSAVDPANPLGAVVPWPVASRRLTRAAGARVVLVGGAPALFVERGGRGIVVLDPELLEPAVEALTGLVADGRVRRLAIERVDGEPIGGTQAERLLMAHGFLQAPRRVVLRA